MAQTFQLVMKSGPTPGKVFDLTEDEITIGRDTAADLTVSDAEVSRKHARLFKQGTTYMLEDLGSTNGTYVNGQRLMGPHALRNGELIMFGENVGLVFEASSIDMDATIAAGPGQFETPPPVVRPSAQETAAQRPVQASKPAWEQAQPEPAYVGQVPEGPSELSPAPLETKNNTRTWILAGCGCLILLCCVVVAGAYAFDAMNLYCQPPFDLIFNTLGYCPP